MWLVTLPEIIKANNSTRQEENVARDIAGDHYK
jgi:hypothetical protein